MLLLLKRSVATPVTNNVFRCYATLPKKAAGKFTSNKMINEPNESHVKDVQQTLVYIGPFAETMRRYKMTASFFGLCGIFAVPALLSTGQAPVMSVALETVSFWGRFKEDNMWLSQLRYKSTPKGITWQQKTGAEKIYTLEREIIEADPYLKALADRVQRKEA
ncbi:hypothetical protein BD770DRAFT_311661 [Pilaira anomala]|nr:hypothetical protein BD770DRAFT_311661 [Pilaira anomala]